MNGEGSGGRAFRGHGPHPVEVAAVPDVGEADEEHGEEDEHVGRRHPARRVPARATASVAGVPSNTGTAGRSMPSSRISPAAAGVSAAPSAVTVASAGSASCVALPKTVAHGKKSATSTSKMMNKSATT